MNKMKFVAGITLYHPTSSQIEKLKDYSASFDYVFFFDNTDSPDSSCPSENVGNIIVLGDGVNHGLSYAFNCILKQPECVDADFLCTLDQDSVFTPDDIRAMKEFLEARQSCAKTGIVGPYIDYGYDSAHDEDKVELRPWVITSGSFVNLNALYSENFLYDENYFIDKFEIDLCMQFRMKGYSILMNHNAVLHQTLGEYSGHRHPNHSVVRHYYLFRNRFYFNKKWYKPIKRWALDFLQTCKHLSLILLYENEKLSKIKMLVKAFSDFAQNRMGAIRF